VLGVVLVGVAVLGLTGGLDRVPPAPVATGLPMLAVKENADMGPYLAQVTNAVITDDLGFYKPRATGNHLLAVVVRIELTKYSPDSLASSHFFGSVGLRDVAGLVEKDARYMLLARDASQLEYINPGLPERVAFVFEVDKAAPVPAQVIVVLSGSDVHWSWTNRVYEWTGEAPKAEVTVPVVSQIGAP
jgi:hypothetical protein